MSEEDKVEQPIIVKRIKKGGGHHGGAWKVAYADFVTAMMAFFLLLWLLNVSTQEELNAISNYFDPSHPKVSSSESGAGGVMGGLTMSPDGAMTSDKQPITQPPTTGSSGSTMNAAKVTAQSDASNSATEAAKELLREQEEKRMEDIKSAIEDAIASNPDLQEMKDNLIIDMTPEGLRIQIIDQDGKPMFAAGSARMFAKTQKLLQKVGDIIKTQPNELSIRGHTDSSPYAAGASYTNWELSADRANSSRRVLLDAGFKAERINNVVGKADTDHLMPDDPTNPRNRRVSIILLKEELTNPDFGKNAGKNAPASKADEKPEQKKSPPIKVPKIGTFQKSSGNIEFP